MTLLPLGRKCCILAGYVAGLDVESGMLIDGSVG